MGGFEFTKHPKIGLTLVAIFAVIAAHFGLRAFERAGIQGLQMWLNDWHTWLMSLFVAVWGLTLYFVSYFHERVPTSAGEWKLLKTTQENLQAQETQVDSAMNIVWSALQELENLKINWPRYRDDTKEEALLDAFSKMTRDRGALRDTRRNPRLRFVIAEFISLFRGLAEGHPNESGLLRKIDEIEQRDDQGAYKKAA